MIEGKIPPQAIDIEEAVLGAIMLEKSAIGKIFSLLEPNTFYNDSHKLIFEAIQELYNTKRPIDMLTVTNALKMGKKLDLCGGAYYIMQLTNKVASSANIEYHAHILIEMALKRRIIKECGEVGMLAFKEDQDAFELKNLLETKVLEINKSVTKNKEISWSKAVNITINQIETSMKSDLKITGIPTGNSKIDNLTGGWQNSDLIILAGRPGMGKTARALSFMKAAILAGKKVKFYSFEMSINQLIRRLIADSTGIDMIKINRGYLTNDEYSQVAKAAQELINLPIQVNDNGRMTMLDISSDCRILKSKGELDMIIIDYLQITKSGLKKVTRVDEIGFISGECKSIAKECEIPVMALAQVRRNGSERPDLEDLRESGSIEQDADLVMFNYRPSYYTLGDQSQEKEHDYKEMSLEQYNQLSELINAKNRNGKVQKIIEYFDGSTQTFKENYGSLINNNLPF
jgi:replicative DNA helicase